MVQIRLSVARKITMKLNLFLNAFGRFGSEAGSEQSTNFRWWDSSQWSHLSCRPDLKNPPTSVGGISEYSNSRVNSRRAQLGKLKRISPQRHREHGEAMGVLITARSPALALGFSVPVR